MSAAIGARGLDEWLRYIDRVHPRDMDLGLDRVRSVAHQMELLPLPCRSVIVAGTNGKGSTCIALEAVLRRQGYATTAGAGADAACAVYVNNPP